MCDYYIGTMYMYLYLLLLLQALVVVVVVVVGGSSSSTSSHIYNDYISISTKRVTRECQEATS
jgi:hypothetical protein